MAIELNSYELSRRWFDWAFDNPELIKPEHTAIYFFAIEHCNRLGWKDKFGFPSQMVMDALGIKKNRTFIKYFDQLCDWGFIKLIQKSQNQYSSNIISLSFDCTKKDKATAKPLDKAMLNHRDKHMQKQVQPIGTIDKQLNNLTTEQLNQEQLNNIMPDGSYQKFLEIYSGWYEKRVGVKISFDGMQGKALKKIITFLIANSKEKNCTGGADAWEYILLNWHKLDKFYQDQIKVNQIQSNLPNILNQLKNGNSKSKPANDRNNIHHLIDEMFGQPSE